MRPMAFSKSHVAKLIEKKKLELLLYNVLLKTLAKVLSFVPGAII